MPPKIYLKNLHAFRFFAAAAVIVCHLELYKNRVGIAHIWKHPLIFELGAAGVDFFFVLSGFLITTLLLNEKKYFGTINIKKFYIRRILRIWPLYYLVILTCFLLIPHIPLFDIYGYSETLYHNFWQKFLFCLGLMPNVALPIYGEIPYAAPAWSIGVEEQFYILWPLLILFLQKGYRSIVLFILFFIGIKVLLFLYSKFFTVDLNTFTGIKDFFVATRMECMGIGGLGALLVFNKHRVVDRIKSNGLGMAALTMVPVIFYIVPYLYEIHHIALALCFLVIIINSTANENSFVKLENKPLYTLGNISYGLYLLHPLAIGISLNLLRQTNLPKENAALFNILYYLLTFSITIVTAYVSYRFFEKRFLDIKQKHTLIISGNDAKTALLENETQKVPVS
jgi:peptidoglycan/LPS O-acetylase OafA/YrhL